MLFYILEMFYNKNYFFILRQLHCKITENVYSKCLHLKKKIFVKKKV